MAVSRDALGWTVVTASGDSRIIYVSSTGNDANNGLSSAAPKATIAAGMALLRNNMPDWLLLKKGDTWNEIIGQITTSGRGVNEPMLIGAYGTGARPLLKCGDLWGIFTIAEPENYVAIIGIEFYADQRDPASPSYNPATANNLPGLSLLTGIGDGNYALSWLIEDCKVSFFGSGVNVQGTWNDFTIRRNIIINNYQLTTGPHSQGIFASSVIGLVIEENLVDHNGWNADIVGAEATIFNHNVYLSSNNGPVVVRWNIIANASSHGMQARAGGQVYGNLFIDNPIHMNFGVGDDAVASGDYIQNNVYTGTATINGAARGNALEVHAAAVLNLSGNLVTTNVTATGAGIFLNPLDDGIPSATGINGLTIEGNIVYKWPQSVNFTSNLRDGTVGHGLSALIVRNNKFSDAGSDVIVDHGNAYSALAESWSNNVYNDGSANTGWFKEAGATKSLAYWLANIDLTGSGTAPSYPDPTRTPATYCGSLGGTATTAGFLARCRLQSKSYWSADFKAVAAINYIRAGFGLAAITGGPTVSRSAAILATQTAHLKFLNKIDELSGNFADSSGHSKTGVASGAGITYAQAGGFDGPIASFNGTTGYATYVASPLGGTTLPSAGTLFCEILHSTFADQTGVSLGNSGSGAELDLSTNGTICYARFVTDGSAQAFFVLGDGPTADGALQTLCATWDMALSSDRIKLYRNGVQVQTNNTALGAMTLNTGAIAAFTTGGSILQKFTGQVGNVAGWDIALTATEIATIQSGIAVSTATTSTMAHCSRLAGD